MLGLQGCTDFFSSCIEQGLLSSCGARLLIAVPSLATECGPQGAWASRVAAPRLRSTGSGVVAHGLSWSTACGIFPDQGSNPRLQHWQVDSLPQSHQVSPSSQHFKNANPILTSRATQKQVVGWIWHLGHGLQTPG